MDNVRQLSSVPTTNPAELIATGLEHVVRELRNGTLPSTRCAVILSGPEGNGENGLGLIFLGAEARLAEVVGMLEVAKFQVIEDGGV